MTVKTETRAMLDSLHAQMGEWLAELDHRADLDEGEAWLMQDIDEWRRHIAEGIEPDVKQGELDMKDDLCPLSGIGKPPSEWGRCVVQCCWYDATSGLCAVQALWHLRELPSIAQDANDTANALIAERAQ